MTGQHGVEGTQELGDEEGTLLPVLKHILYRRVEKMGTGLLQSLGLPLSFMVELLLGLRPLLFLLYTLLRETSSHPLTSATAHSPNIKF